MASLHSILPVVESDVPLLGELLFQSKLQLTINRLLWNDWPNEAAQRPQYARAVRGGFNDDSVENLKVVDNKTGEIIGFLGLSRKRPAKTKQAQPGPGDQGNVPAHFNPDVLAAVNVAVSKCTEGRDAIDHYGVLTT
ncbi:hypothetical protein A1O3_01433 [Capronia epimyces CBS 606.96]|uniref:N-acetyltransferase domain-containing protein n=1 Tax=Capronia epimyces CBS 606.96 TaxID=1182542 RepID=W9ZEH1_9EURO|nr:uncharacterized protein A1O3_01433 [Capronia epimyces CBS 606.96]EXJ92879.1 hypothetical protein A1O3_01433 [Capronia epimyces CBS 606.96]